MGKNLGVIRRYLKNMDNPEPFEDRPIFMNRASFKKSMEGKISNHKCSSKATPEHFSHGIYTGCHNGRRYFVVPSDTNNASPWGA